MLGTKKTTPLGGLKSKLFNPFRVEILGDA